MSIVLRTKSAVALGNGTRPPGFVVATFKASAIDECLDIIGEMCSGAVGDQVSQVDLSEGVIAREFVSGCLSVPAGLVEVVDSDAVPEAPTPAAGPPDLSQIQTSDLGLTSKITKALTAAAGATVADLQAFADEYDGFQTIDGIGPETEQQILDAIKAKL